MAKTGQSLTCQPTEPADDRVEGVRDLGQVVHSELAAVRG